MQALPRPILHPFLFVALAAASHSQTTGPAPPPSPGGPKTGSPSDTVLSTNGRIVDLLNTTSGRLVYATREGEVGELDPATRQHTVLSQPGSYPHDLRAVALEQDGSVVVLDAVGDVYEVANAPQPPTLLYDDLYMIQDATDLVVDGGGNFIIASATPSDGQRCTNRVSADGVRWDYHIVRHQPVQIAADPLTGDILMADQAWGGALRLIDSHDRSHPTRPLDTSTQPGISSSRDDGDMAVEVDGDLYWIAGGEVWFHNRSTGNTNPFASGFDTLRGVAIGTSASLPSVTLQSLYVAEGDGPSRVREIAPAGPAASTIATDQGRVPGRGIQRMFLAGIQAFELTQDNDGDLLVGGHLYGSNPSVHRIDTSTMTKTVVADAADGISGTVEGIVVAADDTIYALTRQGVIHAITESPFSVTTVYTDPANRISAGKDLALDVDGTFYVADRDYWGGGEVVQVSNGIGSTLTLAAEVRGLSADPMSGGIFVSEWNCPGFCGEVGLYDFGSQVIEPIPGFDGINFTNDLVWGDGDTVVDVNGSVYTVSEDDWSVVRYDPEKEGYVRLLSSFLNHPSGVAIAPSSEASATGWSLYVSEFDFLWEHKGVPAPAAVRVDSQTSMQGVVAGVVHPGLGRPRDLVPDPTGDGVYVSTSTGVLVRLDLRGGPNAVVSDATVAPFGDLVGLDALSDGRLVVANRAGDLFAVDPARGFAVEVLHTDSQDILADVHGLAVDPFDRLLLVDRYGDEGLLVGYDGLLRPLAPARRGLRPAIDPISGHFYVSARGANANGGSLRRVNRRTFRSKTARSRAGWGLAFGETDGGIEFDAAGNVYLATGTNGRVVRIDRRTGALSSISGNHARPEGLALGNGRPGVHGPEGTSLFVLDGWTVFEIGVVGRPAD